MSDRQGCGRYRSCLIFTGCLGCGCGGALLIVGLIFVSTIGAGLFSLFKSSGTYRTYQLASETIKRNPTVIEILGAPISSGWEIQTDEQYGKEGNDTDIASGTSPSNSPENSSPDGAGRVCLRFPISGKKAHGSAYVESMQKEGVWNFYQLKVNVDGQSQPIVLIKPPSGQPKSLCPNFDKKEIMSHPTPSVYP
jgi:Cytochrome oxidase complex assembly protein 1